MVGEPVANTARTDSFLRWGTGLMILGALAIIALGVIFFVNNFTSFFELGIGAGQVDKDEAEIKAFSPSLRDYISHLHIAVSGLLATTGLFVILLTWYGVRRRQLWAWIGAVVISTFALVTVLPSHYAYDLGTLGHLGIAYVASATFFVGALLALWDLRRSP
jgi:hypothetical protein